MATSIFQDHTFLDFHTHRMRHETDGDVIEIVSLHLGQHKPSKFFTVGLHPWWTTSPLDEAQRTSLVPLLSDPACLAMGEMGLDQLKGPPMAVQMDILRSQLHIAQSLNKPVIIHCVRAYDQLLRIKKEFPGITKWCVHGYGRHAILARQLIDQGLYLSLMPTVAAKYVDWFGSLPHDRLFLETDSMPDTDITTVYANVAGLTGMRITDLQHQMNSNARTFFGR